jgi:hypothetical protein
LEVRDVTTGGGETLTVEGKPFGTQTKPGTGNPPKAPIQTMNPLTHIRRLAIGKANTLQRAARHLPQLAPAFAEWSGGEIYICRKTGSYRYRFGDASKSITPWDALARELFATPAAFAFAALVLGPAPRIPAPKVAAKSAPAQPNASAVSNGGRVNVIQLAQAA